MGALGIVLEVDGLPGYEDYLRRSEQTDGSDALLRFNEEQFARGPESYRDRFRPLFDRLGNATD